MSWWSQERILQLINELHSRPILWDVNSPDFTNRHKKREVLQEIAGIFSDAQRVRSADEIDKKIKNMKVQFRREHKVMCTMKKRGILTKRTNWFGYEPLLFLATCYEPYKSITMDNDIEGQDDLSRFGGVNYAQEGENALFIAGESSSSSFTATPGRYDNQLKLRTLSQRSDKKRRFMEEADSDSINYNEEDPYSMRDEFSVFGELVANKLRKFSTSQKSVAIAQHRINAILFDLEMEQYDANVSSDVGFYSTGSSFVSALTYPCSNSKTPSPSTSPKTEPI